jgi:hypothetical protein
LFTDEPTEGDTGIGATVDTLGFAGLVKVLFHVGTVLGGCAPTDGHADEPTDGATADPSPEVPACCASAAVPERANAVASTMLVSFMVASFPVV